VSKKSNPFPFLALVAAILWCGLFLLKKPEMINSLFPSGERRTIIPKAGPPQGRAGQPLSPKPLAKLPLVPPPTFPRVERPQAAIILDDFGYSLQEFDLLRELYLPVSISILPHLPASRKVADLARAAGYEILLHLPMAPKEDRRLEDNTISSEMSQEEIEKVIEDDLKSLGPVSGVNNHMGSAATADRKVMEVIIGELKKHDLFFVDSVTTPHTVGYKVAVDFGVLTARRDVFLDNEKDPEYIKGQIRQLIAKARKNGRAIGIGHAHPITFQTIKEMLPEFEEAGVSLTTVSQLLKR